MYPSVFTYNQCYPVHIHLIILGEVWGSQVKRHAKRHAPSYKSDGTKVLLVAEGG
ncbi:hypothetical protein BPA01_25440 [Brevibacillus parabrevis]|uniref:Uncharacterized protein n=1 Tax=Brevibacillus parabrevis TaxID=54914 RepID=A0A4Y3PHN7_BREPA|nr:hypothetical protein BPA01_25440 [Brevibacillus parabrevis]